MLTDVFVPLLSYPDEAMPTALGRVSALVEHFATQVTYCGVLIEVPDLTSRWGAALIALPQMVARVEQRSQANAADLLDMAATFRTAALVKNVTIKAVFGDPGTAIAHRSRYHDVTVLPIATGTAIHAEIAQDLIFGGGRPLIIVPEAGHYPTALSRVAIAWDGSSVASRAVYDAMPLLAKADHVAILSDQADKPIPATSVDFLRQYLERHGVGSSHIPMQRTSAGIGAALQDAAAEVQAGLLVMGAFGHNRFRELVLGGATDGVLKKTTLPIFLSR